MKTMFPKNPPREIEREVRTLERDQTEIMRHAGQFVLIQGDSVVNFFPSYGAAITDGYQRFGLENFLVQEIRTHSRPIRAMRCGTIKHEGKLRLTRARTR
jgi:hypothetical protein